MSFAHVIGRALEHDADTTPREPPRCREHPTIDGRIMFTPADSDPDFPVGALDNGEWLSGRTLDLEGWV